MHTRQILLDLYKKRKMQRHSQIQLYLTCNTQRGYLV